MKMYFTQISDFAKHKDLRCGLGLIQFLNVVSELISEYWPSVKLGDVLTLEYGKGLSEEKRMGGDFPVVGSNGIVGYHDDYLVEGPCIIVGRKGSAGEINYFNANCFPIDTTFYVKLHTNLFNLKFLYYLLRLLRLQRLALFKGVPGLNRFDAYEVKIPLIPLPIQANAVEQVELVEHEIGALQAQIKKPVEIINGVFAREFGFDDNLWREFGKQMTAGTQNSNPKEMHFFTIQFAEFARTPILRFSSRLHNPMTRRLMDILNRSETINVSKVITQHIHRGKQPMVTEDGVIPAIKTAQLKDSYIDLENCERVSEEFYDKNPRAHIKKGDILLASTGKVSLGKIDHVDFDEPAVVDGHISIIRLDESQYDPLFFTYFFRSILGAFQVERDFTGATNQVELYPDEICDFIIPSIDRPYQEQIAGEIKDELERRDELLKQKIKPKLEEINKIVRNAIFTAPNKEQHLLLDDQSVPVISYFEPTVTD